jgi:hypothetical protein
MTEWDKARCIGKQKLFFDDRQTSIKKARLICLACPIRSECLDHALKYREAWGVWAGLDYQELRIVAASMGYLPPNRREVEHGTERGWAWHRRQRSKDATHTACQPCIDAYNLKAKVRVARYRKRKSLQ